MSNVQNFNFLPQAQTLEDLLKSCVEVLQHIPADKRNDFVKSLREFEKFCAPTLWSVDDVDVENEHDLSDDEKRDVMSRLVNNFECTDHDWTMIESYTQDVISERAVS